MWAQRGIVWKGIRVFKQCEGHQVGNTRSRKNTEVTQLGPRIAQLDGGDHSIGLDVDAGATNTVKSQKRRNGPLHYYWLLWPKKRKVVFTSPKRKMFLALARAERGERAGEPHSEGLVVCWCRLLREPLQPLFISAGGSKLRKNFFVQDSFSVQRKTILL